MNASKSKTTQVQLAFIKHTSRLRGFILALLPDFTMAEDVLQEVFLVVTRKAEQYQEGTNFFAWICEIARRKILEYRRREQKAAGVMLSPEVLEAVCEAAPDEEEEQADVPEDRLQALANCVDELAPKTRQIVKMRYRGGCRPAEIARRMSWKPQAVYVALSRTRKSLRNCVERKVGREAV